MQSHDPDDLKEKRICIDCVGDNYLKSQIEKARDEADCSYCSRTAATIEVGDLAELVHSAFESHFVKTPHEPSAFDYAMMNDKESDYDWTREGYPVVDAIASTAEISDEAAEDIRAILEEENSTFDDGTSGEEEPYDSDSYYQEKPATGEDWQLDWDRFENSLRTETRFFSREAENLLASIFQGVESLRTTAGNLVIVEAGPNTGYARLYRARLFQSDKKLAIALKSLDAELAPPPEELAMAGRMNARGISVFYGATDAPTALAEIRPPVGSKVVIGSFEVVRQLHLLDLAALSEVRLSGSVFDPIYKVQLERAAFLETLGQRITRPVVPDDEALDYIVTQAIADYLATSFSHPVDGIIYKSAQTDSDARNVVLFHKAANVERFDRPYGTEVISSLGHWDEGDWEVEYEVIETVPSANAKEPEDPLDSMIYALGKGLHELDVDSRQVTLRLDRDTICVHDVEAVAFATRSSAVRHIRWEKKDGESPF